MKQFVLKKINELRRQLDNVGLSSESSLLLLLYKFAGYDDEWRNTVDELSRENPRPFDDWFGNKNKIYLPFEEKNVETDPLVEAALMDLGFYITDYVLGYAEKDGRVQKIGKIITKTKKDISRKVDKLISELNQDFPDGSPDRVHYEFEKEDLELYKRNMFIHWDEVMTIFRDSKIRSDKSSRGRMIIVISQDPHDIAQMSYERSWTSCMNLGEGAYYKDLLCEVSGGGFVAYLVDKDDTEIKKPIARIHIRRFDSKSGRVIALLEDTAYGNNIEGFSQAVKGWVDSMNKNMPAGVYRMKGGGYSDTYSSQPFINLPDTTEEKIRWLNENLPEFQESLITFNDKYYHQLNDKKYWEKFYHWDEGEDGDKVFSNAEELSKFRKILEDYDPEERWLDILIPDHQHRQKYDKEEYERVKKGLREDRFKVEERTDDHTSAVKKKIIDSIVSEDEDEKSSKEKYKYGPGVHLELQKSLESSLDGYLTYQKTRFYRTYPHLMTDEIFETYDDADKRSIMRSDWISEESKIKFAAKLRKEIVDKIDINSPFFEITSNVIKDDPESLSMFYKKKMTRLLKDSYELIYKSSDLEVIDKLSNLTFKNIMPLLNTDVQKDGYSDSEAVMGEYVRIISFFAIEQENKRKEVFHLMSPFDAAFPVSMRAKRAVVDGLEEKLANEFVKVMQSPYYKKSLWPDDHGTSIHSIGARLAGMGKKAGAVLPLLREHLEIAKQSLRPPHKTMWLGTETEQDRDEAGETTEKRIKYVIKAIETGALPETGGAMFSRLPF